MRAPGRSGQAMWELARDLFPLNRSLTGEGVRATLRRLSDLVALEVHEVPSGTRAFDWTVPPEWTVRDAWIRGPDGRTVVHVRDSNLHLVGYSAPVRTRLPLERLRERLHTLPEQPDRIPYRTSYWDESWGFCLRHRDFERLPDGEYEVLVDSSLGPGSLTYGELYLEGEREEEVLLSAHVCHPSLANDNLSGVVVAAHLAAILSTRPRRLSYRFLFLPATIGPLVWLARNRERLGRIRSGLVLTCLGDAGPFTYKRSRGGRAPVDVAATHLLERLDPPGRTRPFTPLGYDERQYGSPGFDLPVGRLTRTPHGEYPEYHTSADDLELVRPEHLEDSLDVLLRLCGILERDRVPVSRNPHGEPQLGRRGLYRAMGGEADVPELQEAILWTLNLADGRHSLLDIAARAGKPFELIDRAAELLEKHELVDSAT